MSVRSTKLLEMCGVRAPVSTAGKRVIVPQRTSTSKIGTLTSWLDTHQLSPATSAAPSEEPPEWFITSESHQCSTTFNSKERIPECIIRNIEQSHPAEQQQTGKLWNGDAPESIPAATKHRHEDTTEVSPDLVSTAKEDDDVYILDPKSGVLTRLPIQTEQSSNVDSKARRQLQFPTVVSELNSQVTTTDENPLQDKDCDLFMMIPMSPLASSPMKVTDDGLQFPAIDNSAISGEQLISPSSSLPSSGGSGKRSRKSTPCDVKTRKRQTNHSRWKSVVAKDALNTGNEHFNVKGKLIRKRQVQRPCEIGCRLKCTARVSEDMRRTVHEQFWKLGNHVRQWDFIGRHVQMSNLDQSTNSRKSRSFKYFFRTNHTSVRICKTMFLSTLDICDNWIKTAFKKMGQGCHISPDKRGKNPKRTYLIPEEVKASVIDHINSFPRVESHYVRKTSSREYLEENLCVTHMHILYLQWIKERGVAHKPATLRQYRDIFNSTFNISFFKPKKDQCDICNAWQNVPIQEKQNHQTRYDAHMVNKEMARTLKAQDKEDACKKENTQISMACFDFQKILQTPQGQTSIFYYKRKFAVYNFTVYDVARHEGNCYCYDETIAKKGANEVASFVFDFIKTKVEQGVRSFRFYSDNCSGQNRNRFVFAMYVYAACKFNISIIHRFLERGHTQNEGDSVHSLIERRTKGHLIYTPSQWYSLIRDAKRSTTNPYKVFEVNQTMIFDFKEMAEKQNWGKNVNGDTVPWSKVREVHASGSSPSQLNYKLEFKDEYSTISTKKKGRPLNLLTYTLKQAYSSPFSISTPKLKDLLDLCNNNAIPPAHQTFYRNLETVVPVSAPESPLPDESSEDEMDLASLVRRWNVKQTPVGSNIQAEGVAAVESEDSDVDDPDG